MSRRKLNPPVGERPARSSSEPVLTADRRFNFPPSQPDAPSSSPTVSLPAMSRSTPPPIFALLSEEQRAQLVEWLTVENIAYGEARTRCTKQWDFTPSLTALKEFYSEVAAPARNARAEREAEALAAIMAGRYEDATIRRARQMAFEAMSGPQPDVKLAKDLLRIVGDAANHSLRERKYELDVRRVAVLEQKAKLADDAKSIAADNSIDLEEKAAQLRALFHLA